MKLRKLVAFLWGICLLATPSFAASDLYSIIEKEDFKAFSDLYMLGLDIDARDADGYTPLMIASAAGKDKFVSYLIASDVVIDMRGFNGETALHRAAQGGHNSVVTILLDAGANPDMPDFDGFTPMMLAVKRGNLFTVDLLVKRGAEINFYNAEGQTAYDLAIKFHYNDIAKFLKEHGGHAGNSWNFN